MAEYELVYIVRPDIEEENLETVISKVSRAVTSVGGQVSQVERWGKRRLAYRLRKFQEGIFLVSHLQLQSAQVQEVDRAMRLGEEILRHSIIRVDK